jgi:hypothetical protein
MIWLNSIYARNKAKAEIDAAPDGWVHDCREPTRSDDQNRKLHAMVQDLRLQVDDRYSKDEWKLRLMHALRNETRFLDELEGVGQFPVGQKTSTLSKSQFSALIELIYEYGSRKNVRWSDAAASVFAEYGHGRKAA